MQLSENLRYFVRYLVRYFSAKSLHGFHWLVRWQNGKMVPGPRKGMLDLGLKLMSLRLRYFCSGSSLFCPSFPSPFPAFTQSQRRGGGNVSPGCLPSWCMPGIAGADCHPQPPHLPSLTAAFPLLLGWIEGGELCVQRLGRPWVQLGCLSGQGQRLLM